MSRRRVVQLGIVVAAIAGIWALRASVFAPKPVAVRVTAVESGRVELTVTNSRAGTVKARRRAKLSPEVGGRVVALPFREGSHVRAGDVLLRIDDALQRAQADVAARELGAAQAQREQACFASERATRETERSQRLASDGIVSPDLLDQVASAAQGSQAACRAAVAAVERARASLELAQAALAKTVLSAPFDGVIADRKIEVGEWTTPSPTGIPIPAVLDLLDPASVYVSAPMDEVDSGRIHEGQPARVTVDSQPGRSFTARVRRVAPYVLDVEAQNRTVEIEVDLDDKDVAQRLLPGTSADVEVILDARDGVPRLPTRALLEGGRVLALVQGRLVERKVTPGLRNWDFTEVAAGLAIGERVVLSLDRPEVKAGARAVAESGT